jgi:hypothetical protein
MNRLFHADGRTRLVALAATVLVLVCLPNAHAGEQNGTVDIKALNRSVDSLGDVAATSAVMMSPAPAGAKSIRISLPPNCQYLTVRDHDGDSELVATDGSTDRTIALAHYEGTQIEWRWRRFPAGTFRNALTEFDAIARNIEFEICCNGAVNRTLRIAAPSQPAAPSEPTRVAEKSPSIGPPTAEEQMRDALKFAEEALERDRKSFDNERKKRIDEWNRGANDRRKQRNKEQVHEERHGYGNRTGPPLNWGDGKSSTRYDERLADPHTGRKEDARNFDPGPTFFEVLKQERTQERLKDPSAGSRALVTPGSALHHPRTLNFVNAKREMMSDARIVALLRIAEAKISRMSEVKQPK